MHLTTVLFDFDGTLADTLPLTFHGLQSVFRTFDGRETDNDDILSMFGPTEDGIIEKHLQNRAEKAAAIEHYYDVYKRDHARLVPRNKAIESLLNHLHQQGKKIGIITGKSRRAFELSMESMAMPDVFSAVITGDDVEIPKPDPAGIVSTMRQLGAVKEETIYIGDSNNDILAGKAAGIHTAGVHWLGTSQSAHFDARPDFIWTKVDDFIRLLQTAAK